MATRRPVATDIGGRRLARLGPRRAPDWQAERVQSVEEAFHALGRLEPDLLEDARSAWLALAGGGGPALVTQWRVQRYCWEELPRTWLAPAAGGVYWRRATALAVVLDGLGLSRYAAIARSEVTREILAIAEVAPERSLAVARRAAQRSGIEPPSTELLTWGASMGPAEAHALETVADTLELAVAAGELVPGGRGWRDRQSELTAAVLITGRDELQGRSIYEQVLRERMARWVRGSGSTTRSAMLSPLVPRLLDPVPPVVGAGARVVLRPLDWLLHEIREGLALTAAGYLPPRTVGHALDELGWREELIGVSHREVDAYPVLVLREAAARLGLVRRRGNRLLLTPTGRAAFADGAVLWTTVASRLVGPDHCAQAIAWEVVLAVLESGDLVVEEDVRALVQAVIIESGWRVGGRRQPSAEDTSPLFYAVLRELRWLELVEESGALLGRRLRARPEATSLLRAALRHRVLHRDVVLE